MLNQSIGFEFAQKVARAEAVTSRHDCIGPGHLLIGVCKVGNYPGGAASADSNLSASELAEIEAEARAVNLLFDGFSLNRMVFYREIRKSIGAGDSPAQDQRAIRLSDASNLALQAAEKLATGAVAVNSLHLLAVLLENRLGALASSLAGKAVDTEAMKKAALELASQCARPPEVPTEESPVEIGEALDAQTSDFGALGLGSKAGPHRLGLLYELPLRFASTTRLEELLQKIVERLVQVIPDAERGALLLSDAESGSLALRAYFPPEDAPSASTTLAQRAMTQREGFIWQQSEAETGPKSTAGIGTGMYAPLIWREEVLGAICVDHPDREQKFSDDDLRLLVPVAQYAAMAVAHQRVLDDLRRHAELTNRLFSSRFPPHVRKNLVRAAADCSLSIGTRQSQVTVLYADIRGFAELTAQLGPQRMGDLLNEYFPPLIKAVHEHRGTIERFVGDGIFAVFGTPEPDPKQQEHAVRAALEMQAASASIMEARAARQAAACEIGIGIHCGEALHGFIGNAERLEYAVVGDPPNLAARYCSGAGKGEILISPQVHAHVFNKVKSERIQITIKHGGTLDAFRIKSNGPTV
jgi:adenylate cyclase